MYCCQLMFTCFIFCIFVVLCVYCCLTLDAVLFARSQYPEGPATGHLDTGFSWFSCVYKRMLRLFPSFQVAATCLSFSPPELNFLVTYLISVHMLSNHCHRVTTQLQLINIIIKKQDNTGQTGFRWLKIRTSGGLLWTE